MRCWDLVPSFNSMKNEFMAATFLKFLSLVIQLIYGSMGAESAPTKNFLYFISDEHLKDQNFIYSQGIQ